MLCQSVPHNFTAATCGAQKFTTQRRFCSRDTKASACPWLIKASVDTGSLWEDAMIEGFGVCAEGGGSTCTRTASLLFV